MRDRLKYLAGSELGAGVFTADTYPEERAAELQESGDETGPVEVGTRSAAGLMPDDPADRLYNEGLFLLGAACHGCVLVSETSCEQHNDFLDRALVVPTVADADADQRVARGRHGRAAARRSAREHHR